MGGGGLAAAPRTGARWGAGRRRSFFLFVTSHKPARAAAADHPCWRPSFARRGGGEDARAGPKGIAFARGEFSRLERARIAPGGQDDWRGRAAAGSNHGRKGHPLSPSPKVFMFSARARSTPFPTLSSNSGAQRVCKTGRDRGEGGGVGVVYCARAFCVCLSLRAPSGGGAEAAGTSAASPGGPLCDGRARALPPRPPNQTRARTDTHTPLSIPASASLYRLLRAPETRASPKHQLGRETAPPHEPASFFRPCPEAVHVRGPPVNASRLVDTHKH